MPTLRRTNLSRDEINEIFDILNKRASIIEQLVRDSEIQFKRIAQMQAELDLIRRTRDRQNEH